MQIRVGPFSYQIQCVSGDILFEGQACLGLCDNDAMILYLSDNVPAGQRVAVLCHEYMEAWVYHFGRGLGDKEDWCDLFGVAMTQFIQDFAHALDAEALAVLMKQATPAPPEVETSESPETSAPSKLSASDALSKADAQPHGPEHPTPPTRIPVRKVSEHFKPPRPGANQSWRVRVYGPDEPAQMP